MHAFLRSLLGRRKAQDADAGKPDVFMVDPNTLLFSMATIDGTAIPYASGDAAWVPSDFVMHEDEWRQIEFFPASRIAEIQQMLADLANFETAHRASVGFTKIYLRELSPAAVLTTETLHSVARELGGVPRSSPVLFYSENAIQGRIAEGFSFDLGGGVTLYGTQRDGDVTILAANVAGGGEDGLLTRAFMALNEASGVIVVDWRSHLLLTGVTAKGQIAIWRPD